MSGGSFDYAFMRVNQFANDLMIKLDNRKKENEYGEVSHNYSDDVITELTNIKLAAFTLSDLMKETEWLYSGDIGEETFLKNVAEIKQRYLNLLEN